MSAQTIIAVRPEPGLSSTLDLGEELGLPIHGLALSEAEPVAWEMPDASQVQALLVGSANAFRHGGSKLSELTHLPVHAVGQATAEAARDAGFKVALCGEGGLQHVLDTLAASPIHYLRLAGEERITLRPPEGVTITEKEVYRMHEIAMTNEQAKLFVSPAIVLLYSASSAQHFAKECDRLGLDKSRISLAALGPRILAAAGSGWAGTLAAPRPRDAELLAMAQDMWQ